MKNNQKNKFNLSEMIWIGFNYTCGISFTAAFATFMINSNGEGLGLGAHMIWIFLIEGLIAATCAWAFSRMSHIHKGENGAAYIYVRTSFGKFAGWMISFLQYTTMPMIVTSQIVSMIRINFVDTGSVFNTQQIFGAWSFLVWDIVGIIVYALASCTIFFSMRAIKKFLNMSGYIKWGSTFLLVIVLVYLFIHDSQFGNNVAHNSKISVSSFSTAFTSGFFFFMGFETFSTMGKNVENPEKNIGKAIMWIMFLVTLFYVSMTILFLGTFIKYGSNPNIEAFSLINNNAKYLKWLGAIIMLVCTLSLKMNSAVQNSLYSGTILEPFAKEGMINPKYQEVNEYGIPFRASLLNLILTTSFAAVWLIIPDIIQGCIGSTDPIFNFSDITGETALIMIMIYIAVIYTTLHLTFTKKMKTNLFEKIIWIFALIFLIFQFEEFFRNLITEIVDAARYHTHNWVGKIISASLEIIYVILAITFGIIWYKVRYLPIYKKRMAENPQLQVELDEAYQLINN
ncbi:APC family permease [Spiroplasma endosymbiont of Crioceris asparagi]|uniref:APC family permease n=1 Tax=Spiroplasma endosymbiont of Crioceris asparagi TaxID=3066286 RepID=UPI0030CF54D6